MFNDLSILTMSMQIITSAAEKSNANRAGRVLLDPCADLLRDILRENVHPDDFNDVIRQKSDRLPFLTPAQREKVLPQDGQYFRNYSDMDLSLIYILLSTIAEIQPHSQGWGEDPDPGDRSVSANIDRIFMVRNILGYWTSEGLPQIDFDIIWSTVSLAVEDLDVYHTFGGKYIKEIVFLRYKENDPERDIYYMEELQRQVNYSQDISPWYASTANTTYATRASRVLLGPCTDQLRDVLRKEVPLSQFPSKISGLRGHRNLTPSQKKILFPVYKSYAGNYNDMDITLLYFLLRNIPHLVPEGKKKKWGKDPDPSDRSLLANIERIRMVRNNIGHSTQTLSHTEFQNLWSTVRSTVVDLDNYLKNGHKFEKVVDFLRKETMDPERDMHFLQEIQKQVDENQKTKEMIHETNKRVDSIEVEQRKRAEEDQKTKKMIQETNRRVVSVEQSYEDQQHTMELLRTDVDRYLDESKEHIRATLAKMEVGYQRCDREIRNIKQIIDEKQLTPDEELEVNKLKQRLVEINDGETRRIPLNPVQNDCDKLPLEQLFAKVILKEDTKENRKGKTLVQRREVKTPEDMLTKNGKSVSRVFMLGDAAHGKTTYCKWLLKKWCNAQLPGLSGRPMNEWENALSQFDFVFHLPLRHVKPSRANITDMICQDILETDSVLQTKVKQVLSSDKYRCFIIMDGLDEWKPNQSAKDQLRYEGMPNIENMSNCVIFTTMRPWMFEAVAGLVRDDVAVIEILGLEDKALRDVIENVLVHYYEMKKDTAEYKAEYKQIISKLEDKTLKSFLKIPLLAVVCVQIWHMGEDVGNSLTSFYTVMFNMLIERAFLKPITHTLVKDQIINHTLPKALSSKKHIKTFTDVLLKLGKVAYEGLTSKQTKLVFQKDDLENEIGERELQFALEVGLISQKEAPSITTRKVKVHFFHKSIQEFLSAIYIVTESNMSASFCDHLSNVKVIMEFSNVILFICGMCPSIGSIISKHVVSVTDSDEKIRKYREANGSSGLVIELFNVQVSWYRELQTEQSDSSVAFNVSDVYLMNGSDIETVKVTRKFLFGHHVDIRSLWISDIPINGERGITDIQLNAFLSNKMKTRSLVMLYIRGRRIHPICIPTLKSLYLGSVTIQGCDDRPVLTNMTEIQRLEVYEMSLYDRDLGLSSKMTNLQRLELKKIYMDASKCRRFIQSLIDIQHTFDVVIFDVAFDSAKYLLEISPHFRLTIKGSQFFMFTRIWPPTQDQ